MSLLITLFKIILALLAAALALVVGAVAMNHVPLLDTPGLSERLRVYFTTHVAELGDATRFPELQAHDDARDAATLYADTLRAVENLGWEVISHDDTQHRIEAVVTTGLWKFKDDVFLWIAAQPSGGARLYARSQSRVGRGDLGANTRHLLKLVETVGSSPSPRMITPPLRGTPPLHTDVRVP